MNEVIEKIKKEGIKMKPKWHFLLKSIFLIVLSLFLLSLLLFLTSFILRFGLFVSFYTFPWILLLFIVGFVVLLEFLINRYAAAYRRPVIYTVVAVVIVIFLAGLIMNSVNFHERMERRNLPMIRKIYDKPMIRQMMESIRRDMRFEINDLDRL